MQESLEWLASRTKSAFSNLSTSQLLSTAQESHVNTELSPASKQIMQTLFELAKSFQDMADCWLLVLHLKVRVHCFHYLIPIAKEGNYAIAANVESMNYDPLVFKLNKDISSIEEAMSAAFSSTSSSISLKAWHTSSPVSSSTVPSTSGASTEVRDQTTQNMRMQRLKEIICEQVAIKQATKDKKITTV
ncbi:Exocyst complex component 4 [Fukomys damarensis]|uniref:Exocyst complex component Sec8 n=1 Tax=Fukomys damarensis TaxID=885580 RepID=A0A091D1Q3_FUKDA|nr:Exocyst complex component 4 [Fukomys damarensis]